MLIKKVTMASITIKSYIYTNNLTLESDSTSADSVRNAKSWSQSYKINLVLKSQN